MESTPEHFFQCPYCWQSISMLLDTTVSKQEYIEDCEVCCQPIKIIFEVTPEGEVEFFEAINIEQ